MPNPNYIFANTINGNPIYADRAEHDAAGNDIQTTYATKYELPAAPVQSNWNESDSSSLAYIQNKPSIPAAQVQSDWTQSDSAAVDFIKNKPSLATVATSGAYSDLSGTPNLATVATTGSYTDLSNTPDLSIYAESANLATVATSGSYNDLSNKPVIPAAQVNSDWTSSSGISEILHKPSEEEIVAGEGIWIHRANGNVVVSTTGGALSQVQSDWTQSDATNVAYIKHKPQSRNLVAGPGITIVDDGTNVTISVTSLMS